MIIKQESENVKTLNNSSVLGANDEYVQLTTKYGRLDALLALILFVVEMLGLAIMGKLVIQKGTSITETYLFCVTGIFSLMIIGLVILFCIIRRQKLITIGFSKTQAKKSLIMGIILFVLVVLFWGIRPNISGSIKTDITLIAMRIIYYLIFIAFMEELVFRGYIGTR